MLCESDRLQLRSSGGPTRVQQAGRIVGKFRPRWYAFYQRELGRQEGNEQLLTWAAPALHLHLLGMRFLATQLD